MLLSFILFLPLFHHKGDHNIKGMVKDITTISDIQLLVDSFYTKVRNDATIGPVFDARVTDWGVHLEKMYRFWQTLLLGQHTYGDSPFPVHVTLPIDATHFDRWTFLWRQTVDQYFEGPVAYDAKWRGDRMAAVFLAKIMYAKGGTYPNIQ